MGEDIITVVTSVEKDIQKQKQQNRIEQSRYNEIYKEILSIGHLVIQQRAKGTRKQSSKNKIINYGLKSGKEVQNVQNQTRNDTTSKRM